MSSRLAVISVLWLAIGLPAAYAMASYADTTLSDAGQIIGNGKIVVLEPEKWIGKRFPLIDYIDIGDKLKEGKWLVLLYHHDCPKCQRAIQDLSRTARALDVQRVALVESPPYGNANKRLDFAGITLIHTHLANTQEWFVESPLGLLLEDGVVSVIRNGNWFARAETMAAFRK